MNEKQVTTRRRWLRFRLSTILLVITIVALAVAQYVGMRRLSETQAVNRHLAEENAKLRAEAGYLQVDDPQKVAVVRVPALDDMTWRWKVYLPAGKWTVNHLTEGIPPQGIPRGSSSLGPRDGGKEMFVTATVRKGVDGTWHCRASVDQSQLGSSLDESHRLIAPIVGPHHESATTPEIAGDKLQQTFDPKEPVVLMRLRAHEIEHLPGGGWKSKENPAGSDGIMLWFTRVP